MFVWNRMALCSSDWLWIKKIKCIISFCMWAIYATGHMWWSEEDCVELVLSCHFYSGPRAWTQVAETVQQVSFPLNHRGGR